MLNIFTNLKLLMLRQIYFIANIKIINRACGFKCFNLIDLVSYGLISAFILNFNIIYGQSTQPNIQSNIQTTNKSQSTDITSQLLEAEFDANNNKLTNALAIYQKLAADTKDPKIAKRATELAIEADDDKQALKTAMLWADHDKNSVRAQLIASLLVMQYSQVNQAHDYLKQLMNISKPESFNSLELILNHPFDEQKSAEFGKLLEQINDELKNNANTAMALALFYDKSKDPKDNKKSLAYINQAVKINPEWTQAQIQKTKLLSVHESAEHAMNYLEEIVIKYPMQHELRKLYADILYDMEKYQKAAKHYIMLTKYDDYQDHALLQLAYLNITNNDLKEAEKYLLKLSYSQEYKDLAQYYLGLVSQQMGNNQKALDYFDQVKNGEYLVRSKVRAVSILNEQKKYDIAAATLQSIYKSSEENPSSVKNQILAEIQILYEQGLYNDASGILKILEQQQPNDTDVKYSIGILAKKMNNIELFEKNMALVLKNSPENTNALSALGWHYFNKKDNQKALDLLTKAFEHDESHSSSIGARLGAVLWSSGQHDQANIVWKQMLELDPSNQALREIINKYQQ